MKPVLILIARYYSLLHLNSFFSWNGHFYKWTTLILKTKQLFYFKDVRLTNAADFYCLKHIPKLWTVLTIHHSGQFCGLLKVNHHEFKCSNDLNLSRWSSWTWGIVHVKMRTPFSGYIFPNGVPLDGTNDTIGIR